MARTATILVILWLASSVPAAPVADEVPPGNGLDPARAENYARQLQVIVDMIAEQYVQPVSRADLYRAACQGLHEAAREPVPASLSLRIRKRCLELELAALADLAPGPYRLSDVALGMTNEKVRALVQSVRQRVGNGDELQNDSDLRVSVQAMTRLLDRHSGVVSGEELNRGAGAEHAMSYGLALADHNRTAPLLVKSVEPGGPAQKAGIRPGDWITQADGQEITAENSAQWHLRLQRPREIVQARLTSVEANLTVQRSGSGPHRRVKLEPESFRPEAVLGVRRRPDNTWDYLVDASKRIAHIRLAALSSGSGTELREVITALHRGGLAGLILDLRWCPGGLLEEAVSAADLFLGDGPIASTRSRGEQQTLYSSTAETSFVDFPIVVLVNGETSGGAELIAAALKDNKRAVIAGERTVGKASIQNVLPLPLNNCALKLTTGIFMRPSGKNLHRFPDSKFNDDWGITPDAKLEFRQSPELSRQMRSWWLLQTLRPGDSNESLPLDDPEADPQRQAALKKLAGRLK